MSWIYCIGRNGRYSRWNINIGSNFEISIGDTLNIIKELMSSDVQFILDKQRIRPEKSEVFGFGVDNTHIEKLTVLNLKLIFAKDCEELLTGLHQKGRLSKYKATIYNIKFMHFVPELPIVFLFINKMLVVRSINVFSTVELK